MNQLSPYRLLSVRAGAQRYGFALDDVVEIMPMLMLADLPGAPPGVVGLMMQSDGVVPVVDVRLRLGISGPEYRLDMPIVVAHTAQGKVGFLVDDADGVESVVAIEAIACQDAQSACVCGAARLQNGLLLVLDADRLSAGVPDGVLSDIVP